MRTQVPQSSRLVTHPLLALAACAAMVATSSATRAQDIKLSALFSQAPPAPSVAAGYEVVPNWPKNQHRDSPTPWGAMSAVAIDAQGLIWTLNRGELPVQVFDTEGQRVAAWGEDEFQRPHGLGFDPDGSVWITDTGLHVVRKYSTDGKRLLTLGTPGESGDDTTHFDQPTDVAIAPNGTIHISDGYGNNRVITFDSRGNHIKTWGSLGHAAGQFHLPHAIALDSRGRVYVADRSNARVQVFDPDGNYLTEWRNLAVPWDLAVTPSDEIYLCGSSPMRWPRGPQVVPLGIPPKDQVVLKLDTTGRTLELWSFDAGTKSAGALDWVHALAVDAQGNLFLGDIQGQRVQKFRRLPSEAPLRTPEAPRP